MIDTDKYEGHLLYLDYELWALTDFMEINATHEERCATGALLNDAPLLLEEVKRLRKAIEQLTVKVEGMSTGYRKTIVKALREMIE